jgi:hypothetical protein
MLIEPPVRMPLIVPHTRLVVDSEGAALARQARYLGQIGVGRASRGPIRQAVYTG